MTLRQTGKHEIDISLAVEFGNVIPLKLMGETYASLSMPRLFIPNPKIYFQSIPIGLFDHEIPFQYFYVYNMSTSQIKYNVDLEAFEKVRYWLHFVCLIMYYFNSGYENDVCVLI